MYSWTSLFLQAGDAAMFNLSLLTSDVYALLFSFLVENVTPDWLYFVAFAVIFCGLVIYHVQPPPTSASADQNQTRLGFLDAESGAGAGETWAKDSLGCGSHGMSLFELGREFSGQSTDSNTTYDDSGSGSSEQSPPSLSPSLSENKPWLI